MACEDMRWAALIALMIPAFCTGVGFREIFRWLRKQNDSD